MKELYRFRQFLTEGVIKENIMVSPIIMFGGKKYIEDVISSPDDFGFDKDDAEWVKNNILSSPKMVSIQDYMDLDDKWVKQAQIDTSGGGALDHVVDGLKIHVKQELITPEQEKEAMKVVGLSEGVIKEEVDVLGNEFTQEIQDDMKMYYKMDVDMDDIKDWVNMYYIGYNSEYDDGPGDVDYEGNEFGSEDYESEKKELVFDTAEREDFYMHLNPEADSTFPNLK